MQPTESPDRLVVGVDFGTTFSGIAYSYSATPDRPDDIQVIKTWPGGNGITSDKVPSELAYATAETVSRHSSVSSRRSAPVPGTVPGAPEANASSRSRAANNDIFNFNSLGASLQQSTRRNIPAPTLGQVRWGFQLQPDETRLRCLKLFLDSNQRFPSFISKTDMQEQLRRSGKTAATAVSDYLTELFKHAKQTLARRYGDYFVRTTRLEVVLTVPAIWSDAAKEATLSAAKNAGMGDDIRMISEPEAAAVYTLQAIQPNHLKKGDNFIVCDAGGGTVDLISYEIKEVSPLRVEESVRGTGACCGAAFLNVKFEEYVRSKMGASEFQKVCDRKPKAWLAALKSWEEYVKRNFVPGESTEFNIPFPGVEDNHAAGIEQGFLTMSAEAVGSLFHPIITEIIGLVEQQMNSLEEQGKTASGIVLVGGFGQSNCLYKCLQSHFADVALPPPYSSTHHERREPERRFEIMQPNNAWTAVVRGAVLRGLEGEELVLSRKARRHYGVRHRTKYRSSLHSRSERIWDDDEEKWVVDNRITWYIKKGQTCSSNNPILFPFYNTYRTSTGKTQSSELIVCDDDNPPDVYERSNRGTARKLCKLTVNLEPVPSRFWKQKTNSKGDRYQRLDYALGMQIGSGGLRFDQRVDDVVYGDVVAEFR